MDAVARPRLLSTRGAVLLLLLSGLLFSSAYPMRRYFALRAQTEDLRVEERALDERIDGLTRERARLATDQEVERIARERLGMVRPGEVPFVVVSPKPSPAPKRAVSPGGLDPAPAPPEPSVLERWWDALQRALR